MNEVQSELHSHFWRKRAGLQFSDVWRGIVIAPDW